MTFHKCFKISICLKISIHPNPYMLINIPKNPYKCSKFNQNTKSKGIHDACGKSPQFLKIDFNFHDFLIDFLHLNNNNNNISFFKK